MSPYNYFGGTFVNYFGSCLRTGWDEMFKISIFTISTVRRNYNKATRVEIFTVRTVKI